MQQFLPKSNQAVQLPPEIAAMEQPRKLLELLYERGWDTREKIENYLHPEQVELYDPFLMQDMDKAVAVIRDAMEKGEHITVFGDYDVDGVTATAIMTTWLRKQHAQVDYYIPDRHGEGYGLNMKAVEQIAEKSKLLITVDCGITSVAEIDRARELGMRVIVTDHHQVGERIPDCEAVLDPLLGHYPFPRLCGAGVAFKLLLALGGKEAIDGLWDLAALATVADIVPLVDENRVIVTNGLRAMAQTKRPGLRALFEVAKITGAPTSGDIAYKLAPRINAGGRLALASQSVELLTTRNPERAKQIAEELDVYNEKRKDLEMGIFAEALRYVEAHVDFMNDRIVVVCGDKWEQGVVGLVASRLVERYHWPAIVFSKGEDGVCVGSARSIPGINIHEVLFKCQDLFMRFGGHAQAAGLTIKWENIPEMISRVNRIILETVDKKVYIPVQEYDLEVVPEELTESFVTAFEVMQPVGYGNTAPVFCLSAQPVSDVRCLGKDNFHLRMNVGEEGHRFLAIWFRKGSMVNEIPKNADIIASLYINEWHGLRSLQCEVSALRPTMPQRHFMDYCQMRMTEMDGKLLRYLVSELTTSSGTELYREMDMESLVTEFNPILKDEIQGTLIVFHTLQGLKTYTVQLARLLMGADADFAFMNLEDARGFNTVVMTPDWAEIRAGYRRVILMDGIFYTGEVEDILGKFENAEVIVALDEKACKTRWLQSVSSTDEELRALYRLFRQEALRMPSLVSLAELSGRTEGAVLAALIGFDQLGLLRLNYDPVAYTMLPAKKSSLEDSQMFRWFKQVTE